MVRSNNGEHRDPALRVEALWKVFGPRADRIIGTADAELSRAELRDKTGCVIGVKGVSFEVHPGEVFVVMGLSGSGKSTLVRCLTRLVEPTSGNVVIDGHNVTAASDAALRELRRDTVSMVFQHFGLLPHRSVLDNVAYGLEVRGLKKSDRHTRAREVIELVGLSGCEASYPDQLSGGMQQRVGLARALANNPSMILFDEPFSALDPLIRRDMQTEVIRLQEELHKTMVFITHDLQEALKLGDRILIMRDGAVVQVGTPADVIAHPADDYVRDFIQDVPRHNVLTLDYVARPQRVGEDTPIRVLDSSTVVGEAAAVVLNNSEPVGVIRDGELVGVVDREIILRVLLPQSADDHNGLQLQGVL